MLHHGAKLCQQIFIKWATYRTLQPIYSQRNEISGMILLLQHFCATAIVDQGFSQPWSCDPHFQHSLTASHKSMGNLEGADMVNAPMLLVTFPHAFYPYVSAYEKLAGRKSMERLCWLHASMPATCTIIHSSLSPPSCSHLLSGGKEREGAFQCS